jgi:dihydropteroate synthase
LSLNLSCPHSFSDGGTYGTDLQRTVEQALRLVGEGAGILDVGGESTRPGAQAVPAEVELRRVLPAIRYLSSQHTMGC